MSSSPSRHIVLDGSSNLRDIGGYAAAGGRKTRWGVIYRCGAMYRFSTADWDWIKSRNIRAVCDLRSDAERDLAPTVWQGHAETNLVGPAYDAGIIFESPAWTHRRTGIGEMGHSLYPEFPLMLAPSFRAMFGALLQGHAPLIVHCTAGQDRTGLAIGLLLTVLGVPVETIAEDYLLSPAHRRPENELAHHQLADRAADNIVARAYTEIINLHGPQIMSPRPLRNRQGQALLLDAFSAIETRWGSIFAYLQQELGVGPAERQALQALCLEDA